MRGAPVEDQEAAGTELERVVSSFRMRAKVAVFGM
jgi:hypothetical protein